MTVQKAGEECLRAEDVRLSKRKRVALQAKSLPLRWIAGVRQCRTPLFKLQKLILEILLARQKKASVPHFPYFIYGPLESIVCECHGLAHL